MQQQSDEFQTADQVQALREKEEHERMLNNLRDILKTRAGKEFMHYLFDSFSVAEPAPAGLVGEPLHDHLGYLRAGNTIFKIASEADAVVAGQILANVMRGNYGYQETYPNGNSR